MAYDAPKTCGKGSKAVQAPMDRGQDNYVRPPPPRAFMGADRSLDAQPVGHRVTSLHHGEVAPDGLPV